MPSTPRAAGRRRRASAGGRSPPAAAPRPARGAEEGFLPAPRRAAGEPGAGPVEQVWDLVLLVRSYFAFVLLGVWVCADTFLHHVVVVPAKAVAALPRVGRSREAAVEALLGAYLAATVAFLLLVADQGWLEDLILAQRIVKLYWAAQVLQGFDRVYGSWFGTLLRFHRRARGPAELAATAAATMAYLLVQAAVLHALVAVLVVSIKGGGEGIGKGVNGGVAILAVLVPVQLVSELKCNYAAFDRDTLVRSALTDVAHLCLYVLVFAIASLVPGVPFLWDGVLCFACVDLALHLVKQATVARDSRLPAAVHADAAWQVADAWVTGRRRVVYATLGSVSLALAAVVVRTAVVTAGVGPVAAAAPVLYLVKATSGSLLRRHFEGVLRRRPPPPRPGKRAD